MCATSAPDSARFGDRGLQARQTILKNQAIAQHGAANLIPADESGATCFDPEVGSAMLRNGLIFEDGLARL
jgi:hypothetical protein